ncbi:hypothetical protein ACMAZF_00245 [Psychrobium sp. nBUS_13]|uniref:hypothetical protein n=1 Tax=Psychrobium sp. nBUS_13 TaxID=3395319 RepID=UPI003EC10EAA
MTLTVTKTLIFFILLGVTTLAHANQQITHQIDIKSQFTKQPLSVSITLPTNFKDNDDQRYIALYTTASDRRLKSMVEQINWMSHVSFGPIPPLIVVQLPYIASPNEQQGKDVQASGLNTKLTIKILEREILPQIKQRYPLLPFSILEGYSTNANLPLNILADAPHLFNAYISINPAWVLDKSNLMARIKQQLTSDQLKFRSAYISLGNFSQNHSAFEELSTFSHQTHSKLALHLDNQSDINYYTAPMALLPKALEQVFADRNPKDLSLMAKEGVPAVNRYYKSLERKYGYALSPVNTLHDLSDYYGQHNQAAAQIETLEHILKLKPDNIYYRTILANVHLENSHPALYKKVITHALSLAQTQKNQEATDYIQRIIDRN